MPDATPVDPFRLPRTVIPSRYELTLRPDLDAATFSGSIHVALTVQEATDTVVLNAIELEIDEAVVVVGDTRHPAAHRAGGGHRAAPPPPRRRPHSG